MIVVSWPPCWVAVLAKTLPTLPISAPESQSFVVRSRKFRIWAHMLPKRVGVPKRMASASASCSGSITGTWANAGPCGLGPALLQGLLGDQFWHLEQRHLRPLDLASPLGGGLGHAIDVSVHAVEHHLDPHDERSWDCGPGCSCPIIGPARPGVDMGHRGPPGSVTGTEPIDIHADHLEVLANQSDMQAGLETHLD